MKPYERNNKGNIWATYKDSNEKININKNSSPLCQTYTPTFIYKHKPKIGPSHRRQVVHPRPQTPQVESVAKPETLMLIILSIACKYDRNEVHGN